MNLSTPIFDADETFAKMEELHRRAFNEAFVDVVGLCRLRKSLMLLQQKTRWRIKKPAPDIFQLSL